VFGSVFGSFDGLPIHALVVHGAVVITPVAALLGIAFLRPSWRMALRWPLVVALALATATVFVARESGKVLKTSLGDQLKGNITGKAVDHHEQLANRLWIWLLVFLVVAIVVALLLPRLSSPMAGGGVAIIVAALAVVVVIMVVQTGEAGSKARWNPDGSFDYSGG
jgi:preprotein translocase subunit SecG